MYRVERLNGDKSKKNTVWKTEICVQASQPVRSVTLDNLVDISEPKFPVCSIGKYTRKKIL